MLFNANLDFVVRTPSRRSDKSDLLGRRCLNVPAVGDINLFIEIHVDPVIKGFGIQRSSSTPHM